VAAGAASAHGYGTYAMTADGQWTYTLNNGNSDVQALNAGQHLADTFNVLTQDGTSQTVTITIDGANDAAVISGQASGGVVEDGVAPGTPTATGTLSDTDVDNPANTFQAVAAGAASAHGYGTYAMTAGGQWTYTLDNGNAAVQALNAGQHLTDSFNVLTQDGTSQVVTITIDGANDTIPATATGPTGLTFTASAAALQSSGNPTLGAGTVLGTFAAVDSDGGAFTYSETSDAAHAFSVNAASGVVTISSGLVAGNTYTLGVQVADEANRTATQTLVVQLGDSSNNTLTAHSSIDLQYGENGNDALFGGAGNDILLGGNGNNGLHGGAGADLLYGGNQGDTFYFDTALGSGGVHETAEHDVIYNFDSSKNSGDSISLSKAIFTSLTTSAGNTLQSGEFASVDSNGDTASVSSGSHIVFDKATGNLYYDSDGGSASNRTLFATIDLASTQGTLDAGHIVVGT
jgi:VCBS repeat-containing protein